MRDDHRYHVYIVASRSHTLYIGMTSAIATRIQQHKDGTYEGFSKQYLCNRLVFVEPYKYILNAINREKQLKRWSRSKKLALINQQNPAWVDLSQSWDTLMSPPPMLIDRPQVSHDVCRKTIRNG